MDARATRRGKGLATMAELQASFDYSQLETDPRGKLIQLAAYVLQEHNKQAVSMIEAGRWLKDAHEILAGVGCEGKFKPWVEAECNFSLRTAYNYMSVFDLFGKCATLHAFFDESAMIVISAPSTPAEARTKAMKLAKNGHRVSHAKAKELIEECKPDAPPKPPKPPKPTPEQIAADKAAKKKAADERRERDKQAKAAEKERAAAQRKADAEAKRAADKQAKEDAKAAKLAEKEAKKAAELKAKEDAKVANDGGWEKSEAGQPIKKIEDAIGKIARDHYSLVLRILGKDTPEVVALHNALNSVTAALAALKRKVRAK